MVSSILVYTSNGLLEVDVHVCTYVRLCVCVRACVCMRCVHARFYCLLIYRLMCT